MPFTFQGKRSRIKSVAADQEVVDLVLVEGAQQQFQVIDAGGSRELRCRIAHLGTAGAPSHVEHYRPRRGFFGVAVHLGGGREPIDPFGDSGCRHRSECLAGRLMDGGRSQGFSARELSDRTHVVRLAA